MFLVVLLLVPLSQAQLNFIEIKDVNVNENQIQILVENNFNQDFFKETFIINNQYTIIQEETLSNFTTKFFVVNYPSEIKLNNLQVIINDETASYTFTENEDKFIIQQATTSTSELALAQESNYPISYIYSAGRVAKIQDGNIIYFSSDNVGSTSLQTDNLGNIKTKSNYLPFGKELSFSSTGKEKYGFTSKEYDPESSLNYFNARYYNPSNGKFISNDPIFKPSEGGYQYVNNNPLTITDPSGKNLISVTENEYKNIINNVVRDIPEFSRLCCSKNNYLTVELPEFPDPKMIRENSAAYIDPVTNILYLLTETKSFRINNPHIKEENYPSLRYGTILHEGWHLLDIETGDKDKFFNTVESYLFKFISGLSRKDINYLMLPENTEKLKNAQITYYIAANELRAIGRTISGLERLNDLTDEEKKFEAANEERNKKRQKGILTQSIQELSNLFPEVRRNELGAALEGYAGNYYRADNKK